MNPTLYDPRYLSGIECFNRRAYFRSHEVWEDLWNVEKGPSREFFQGLIQAAVALHHLGNGNIHGANKLLAGCRKHLEAFRPRHLGLDLESFLEKLARCFDGLQPSERPRAARRRPVEAPTILLEPPPQSAGKTSWSATQTPVSRGTTGRRREQRR
jgi:uncharacterized protein